MIVEPMISDGARALGLTVGPMAVDPDLDSYYALEALWTTYNGSWEPSNHIYSIPQWARDKYMRPHWHPQVIDDAGADHHLFAGTYMVTPAGHSETYYDRVALPNQRAFFSSDNWNGQYTIEYTKKSGWANVVMFASSNYDPTKGETGPWQWTVENAINKVMGGGLPNNHHVSIWAAWLLLDNEIVEPQPPEPPTGNCEEHLLEALRQIEDAESVMGANIEQLERQEQALKNALHANAKMQEEIEKYKGRH